MSNSSYRWIVLAVLFSSRTGLGLQFQTLSSVSDQLIGSFGFTHTEIGNLIEVFMLPGLLLAIPCGLAGRYITDRLLVTVGLLALALGGTLAAFAINFGMFAIARMICGIGFVVTTIYFAKMVSDWFTGKELATAMALLVTSWPFGIAIGQIGHVWLAHTYDWRIAFIVASIYCGLGAIGVYTVYRIPKISTHLAKQNQWKLSKNELTLTLLASLVWALFNAGYIIFLSFATHVLIDGGYGLTEAAATIFGIAPAGVIMALTSQAMAPHHRAFGMGIFFSSYFLIVAPAPGIAGWLFDANANSYWPMLFAALMFLLTGIFNAAFRFAQRRLPPLDLSSN